MAVPFGGWGFSSAWPGPGRPTHPCETARATTTNPMTHLWQDISCSPGKLNGTDLRAHSRSNRAGSGTESALLLRQVLDQPKIQFALCSPPLHAFRDGRPKAFVQQVSVVSQF